MPHDELNLARVLSGEATPDEMDQLERWLAADPAPPTRRAELERLRELWERAGTVPSEERTNEAWATLAAKAGIDASAPVLALHRTGERPSVSRRLWRGSSERTRRTPWMIAASLLIMLGGGTAIALKMRATDPAPVAAVSTYREYATKNAQRAEILLADGSRVVLAPASRLLVPDDFNRTTRALRLEGEGYFDVVHNDAKPFTVRTERTVTRDLGTAFAITDYAGDAQARVLVAEGEVAVLGAQDTTAATLQLMQRGDLAHVSSAIGGAGAITKTRLSVADLERRLAWVRGGLAFDGVPLDEALRAIGRWYDLEIRLATPGLANRRLVATIGNEPADDVLRLVALTLGLRVERDEGSRVVTFYSK